MYGCKSAAGANAGGGAPCDVMAVGSVESGRVVVCGGAVEGGAERDDEKAEPTAGACAEGAGATPGNAAGACAIDGRAEVGGAT